MTKITNELFMEWVEQYLDNTISPETSQQLLECVQQDPDRLEQLCSQIQLDRLLNTQLNHSSELTETVLQRIQEKPSAKVIRPARWNTKTISRIAASLFVVMSIGWVIRTNVSVKNPELTEMAVEAKEIVQAPTQQLKEESSPEREQVAPKPVERPKMKLAKQYGISKKDVMSPKPSKSMPVPAMAPAPIMVDTESEALDVVYYEIPQMTAIVPDARSMSGVGGSGGLAFSMPEVIEGLQTQIDSRSPHSAPNNPPPPSRETYASLEENNWKKTSAESLSTFSIDVDTASYANIRRHLNQGQLPPVDAVRVEEMINYFDYSYAQPKGDHPFSTAMALHACPWNNNHQLLRVGLQGKIPDEGQKESNLVFLFDVSGSMNRADKLPLLKNGFTKMVQQLGKKDRVAIVVYAGSTGLVLDSTSAANQETIISAMNRLRSGGSTAGGAGIELAYQVATDHYIKGGINRVILATDGDFNVGISSREALQKLIEEKRQSGVFLSVLGFGQGNLNDATMELLANKGNGNYFYIDSEREANKVLVKQLSANLMTIAKDVKIQIEFNPALIRAYRLIGYENRMLAARDFKDDTKDAGEIGAGHQVTALYEIIPSNAPATEDGVPLKYAQPTSVEPGNATELLTLKLRYKEPEGSVSKLLTFSLNKNEIHKNTPAESFRWACAVAAFGQKLHQSKQMDSFSMEQIQELAASARGEDPHGYRQEMLMLIQKAMQLSNETASESPYPKWNYRN